MTTATTDIIWNDALHSLTTVRDFVRFGGSQFERAQLYYGHGTDNAWDEALALVLFALNLSPEFSKKIAACTLTVQERKIILDLFQQRITQRIPVPYLTHEAWFAGLKFYVDRRVIIPRSPIGELLQNGLQFHDIDLEKTHKILDLCTGSGCIAITAAVQFPDAKVDAVDNDPAALQCAQKNIDTYQLGHSITLIESNLFSALASKTYDLILCNPPYVDAVAMATLPVEYNYEPNAALASGDDGLTHAHEILHNAGAHLTEHGVLILEVGASAPALQRAYPHIPFLWLEFAHGGEGVLLLTRDQLQNL